jgi:hypothetical protein
MGHEPVISKRFLQRFLLYDTEHVQGVVIGCFPEIPVKPSEKVNGVFVPGPAKIIGEL